MRNFKKLLASALVTFAVSSVAMAADCDTKKVEAYAHPTMFGSQAQETATAKSVYMTGGKVVKSSNHIGVANKDQVLIDSFVKKTDLDEKTKNILNKGKDKILSFSDVKNIFITLKEKKGGKK